MHLCFVAQEHTKPTVTSCRGHQNFEKLYRAVSEVKYALLTRCAHKAHHRRSGCTSICFADRVEQFKHHHFWHLEQSSCLWGQRAEQEEHRGETFNWTVPSSPAFYSPAKSCIQALREQESSQTNIYVTTILLWVHVSVQPKKHHWGQVSDTQNGSSELVFQANQAHPKCSNLENQRQTPKK